MEWKVGYRFTLEYLITKVVDDYVIAEIGDAENILSAEEMALAKLIQPAATEPQKLDVTKPICIRDAQLMVKFVERTESGRVIIELATGIQFPVEERQLENIPEPKIMGRREAFLGPDGELYWVSSWPGNHPIDILGRTWVEITEGDGMEES